MEDISCLACGAETENAIHLFKECTGFRAQAFASKWGGKVDKWPYSSVQELVEICLQSSEEVCKGEMDRDSFSVFIACLLYYFWNLRNDRLLVGKLSFMNVVSILNQLVENFCLAPGYQPLLMERQPWLLLLGASGSSIFQINLGFLYLYWNGLSQRR